MRQRNFAFDQNPTDLQHPAIPDMTDGHKKRIANVVIASIVAFVAGHAMAQASAQNHNDAIPAFDKLDSMEARVQGCVTCHGQNGQGTGSHGYFPRIAGKPAGYIYNQLVAFRDGTRRYLPMNYLVAYLPDPYLKEIAEYFSQQRPAFAPPQAARAQPQVLTRGQQLVTDGDPQKGVPACVACHGGGLTGMTPGIPGLVGLQPNYIAAQLTRWRVGERHAMAPDCMKRIATRLADTDITAVAAWIGTQVPPADPAPEPSNLVRMPLACGSQK